LKAPPPAIDLSPPLAARLASATQDCGPAAQSCAVPCSSLKLGAASRPGAPHYRVHDQAPSWPVRPCTHQELNDSPHLCARAAVAAAALWGDRMQPSSNFHATDAPCTLTALRRCAGCSGRPHVPRATLSCAPLVRGSAGDLGDA